MKIRTRKPARRWTNDENFQRSYAYRRGIRKKVDSETEREIQKQRTEEAKDASNA